MFGVFCNFSFTWVSSWRISKVGDCFPPSHIFLTFFLVGNDVDFLSFENLFCTVFGFWGSFEKGGRACLLNQRLHASVQFPNCASNKELFLLSVWEGSIDGISFHNTGNWVIALSCYLWLWLRNFQIQLQSSSSVEADCSAINFRFFVSRGIRHWKDVLIQDGVTSFMLTTVFAEIVNLL